MQVKNTSPQFAAEPRAYTAAQVAAMLCISTDTLHRMRKIGAGPPCRTVGSAKYSVKLYPKKLFDEWYARFEAGELGPLLPAKPGRKARVSS